MKTPPLKDPVVKETLRPHGGKHQPTASVHDSLPAAELARCACGGSCPRCAAQPLDSSAIATLPSGLRKTLNSPGQALDPQIQMRMEEFFSSTAQQIEARSSGSTSASIGLGAPNSAEEKNADAMASALDVPEAARPGNANIATDFSDIRVHTDAAANAAANQLGAKAFTVGPRIVFASGRFEPNTHWGERLLVHELAHSLQQRSGPPRIARSINDWLQGSVNVAGLSYTQALSELDELTQWLQRQNASSADTVRIEETVVVLQRRVREQESAAEAPRRRERRGRRAPHTEAPLPARYPRILIERSSFAYTNPAEMREEYDLIMQWLARQDLSANQRQILTVERSNLAPQLQADRARIVQERQAARVQAALSPEAEDDAHALEGVARTVMGISGEPGNPDVFYIYNQGERIAIGREQAAQLRATLRAELERAARRVENDVDYYVSRYEAQVAVNDSSWFDRHIAAPVSGWLADVHDPVLELSIRSGIVHGMLRGMRAGIAAGHMVEVAGMMPQLDRVRQEIRTLSRAFYEGYIEGAEIAVSHLEFTRDAAFAIAGSIAAVVAAPVVAGFVAGAGFTGTTATVLTITGTGATVGTGMGVVRGGSEAGGILIAGGSLSEAAAGFRSEFGRGFREGFVAGAAGGAGRLLGLAAGASASIGEQVLIRVAGDFVVNATSTMVDVLWQTCSAGHCDVSRAVDLGLTNGLASIPGSIVGLSNSNVARYFLGPLTAGASSYVAAIHGGASPEDAMRQAGVAVASNVAMSNAQHGAETDRALVAQGRAAGEATRARVTQAADWMRSVTTVATRRAAGFSSAVMIGVAEPMPALRSGYGGTPIAASETSAIVAPASVVPASMHEAPTTTAPSATTSAPAHETSASSASSSAAAAETSITAATPLSYEEAFTQLAQELGTQPTQTPTGSRAQQIADAHQLAQSAGWVDAQGNPQGPVHAVVGSHEDAPLRRQAMGQTGQTRQSAHIGATSLLRTLIGYSRRLALTVLMPPAQHRAFDQSWIQWIANRRRAIRASGSTAFTAPLSDVYQAQQQAIMQTPNLTPGQQGTMLLLLENEFHAFASRLPNGMATQVPLPAVHGT